MNHRKLLILVSLIGVVASWLLPQLIVAIHETHAFSTVREFELYNMIDVQQVEAYRNEYNSPDYSIFGRVRDVGGLRFYFPVLSTILSSLFIAVAILAWRSAPTDDTSPRDDQGAN